MTWQLRRGDVRKEPVLHLFSLTPNAREAVLATVWRRYCTVATGERDGGESDGGERGGGESDGGERDGGGRGGGSGGSGDEGPMPVTRSLWPLRGSGASHTRWLLSAYVHALLAEAHSAIRTQPREWATAHAAHTAVLNLVSLPRRTLRSLTSTHELLTLLRGVPPHDRLEPTCVLRRVDARGGLEPNSEMLAS
jgi:hypothetical protein